MELDKIRMQNKELITSLISLNAPPKEEASVSMSELKPLGPKFVPWEITRQELERADRELWSNGLKKISTEQLEKDVLNAS